MAVAALLLCLGLSTHAFAVDIPLANWPAPAAWSPSVAPGAKGLTAETSPLPFVAVDPCRVADTRNPAGPYGGPSLAANTTRSFTITGQCGIPASARAVSLNFAVTTMNTAGNLIAWPQGGSIPTISVINWNSTSVAIANAAVVQLNGGGMSVRPNTPAGGVVDLIIDVNGYYYDNVLGDMAFNEYFGVVGVYEPQGGIILGRNRSANGVAAYGVNGYSDSAGAQSAGVNGYGLASTGVVYGVQGTTHSQTAAAAGVYGVDSTGDPGTAGTFLTAGVLGASAMGYGGHFVSANIAVKGVFINNDSSEGAFAELGAGSNIAMGGIGNLVLTGTKSFVDPHPTDPTKAIDYVALEGPEAGTYFRGRGRIHNGVGTILVPESFRLVTDEEGLTVQVTPIGQVVNVAVMSLDLDSISVKSSARELEFFYVVNGVRRNFRNHQAIVDSASSFAPEGPGARMSGALSPEQKAALVANGTYNADGTVNMKTAESAGWTKVWAERAARAKALAAANAKALEETDQAKDIGHNIRTR
jgi:hypothetical protein